MGLEDRRRDAGSVVTGAEAEDVCDALLGRLAERYVAPNGILRIGTGSVLNYRTRPMANPGVSAEDAHILAAFAVSESTEGTSVKRSVLVDASFPEAKGWGSGIEAYPGPLAVPVLTALASHA